MTTGTGGLLDLRPALRPGIVVGPALMRGAVAVHLLKDPVTGVRMEVGAKEHFIIARLDGKRSLGEIGAEYAARFGARLGEAQWQRLLRLLSTRQLLDSGRPVVAGAVPAAQPAVRSTLLSGRTRMVADAPALMDRLHGVTAFGRRPGVVRAVSATAVAVLVYVAVRLPELADQTGRLYDQPVTLFAVGCVLWVSLGLHELAHGVVARAHGLRVGEIGLQRRWGLFTYLYCEVEDVQFLGHRGRQVAVALAGVVMNLLFLLPFLLAQALLPSTAQAAPALGGLLLLGTAMALLNLLPLPPLDGYKALGYGLATLQLATETRTFVKTTGRAIRPWGGSGAAPDGARQSSGRSPAGSSATPAGVGAPGPAAAFSRGVARARLRAYPPRMRFVYGGYAACCVLMAAGALLGAALLCRAALPSAAATWSPYLPLALVAAAVALRAVGLRGRARARRTRVPEAVAPQTGATRAASPAEGSPAQPPPTGATLGSSGDGAPSPAAAGATRARLGAEAGPHAVSPNPPTEAGPGTRPDDGTSASPEEALTASGARTDGRTPVSPEAVPTALAARADGRTSVSAAADQAGSGAPDGGGTSVSREAGPAGAAVLPPAAGGGTWPRPGPDDPQPDLSAAGAYTASPKAAPTASGGRDGGGTHVSPEAGPVGGRSGLVEEKGGREMGRRTPEAIVVEGAGKRYGEVTALEGVSLRVERGEFFGVLGPNGAGKTTLVEIVGGMRKADTGTVQVFGESPWPRNIGLLRRIGVQTQASAFFTRLTAWEHLETVAALHGADRAAARRALDRVGLRDKERSRVDDLSGGQRQRLALATALVHEPDLIFLDEPTAALDPEARRALWAVLRELRGEGRTIVYTTHYLDEAEALCDRVAVIAGGNVVALDTPAALIRSMAAPARLLIPARLITLDQARALKDVDRVLLEGGEVIIETRHANRVLVEAGAFVDMDAIQTRTATLEDAYLRLTATGGTPATATATATATDPDPDPASAKAPATAVGTEPRP